MAPRGRAIYRAGGGAGTDRRVRSAGRHVAARAIGGGMLGNILGVLTDAASAEEALAAIGVPWRRGARPAGRCGRRCRRWRVRGRHGPPSARLRGGRCLARSSRPHVRLPATRRHRIGSHAGPCLSRADCYRRHAASIMNTITPAFGCGGGHFFRGCVGPPQSDAEPPLASEAPIDATPGDIVPATCCPSFCSSAGRQGTNWKPRPSSIMANRPDASVTRCR